MIDDIVKGAVEGFIRGILARKPGPDTGHLEAKSFVLRDDAGRGRAVLGMFNDGPCLSLLNGDGQCHALFGLDPEGIRLYMWGGDSTTLCQLSMVENQPALQFSDAKGVVRVLLRLYANGPTLQLSDQHGKVRAEFDLPDGESIAFRLFDGEGRQVAPQPSPSA